MSECPICMELIREDEDVLITKCKHKFHASCVFQNIKTNGYKCPNCRGPFLHTPINTTTVRETHIDISGNNIDSIIEIINTRPYEPDPRFASVSSNNNNNNNNNRRLDRRDARYAITTLAGVLAVSGGSLNVVTVNTSGGTTNVIGTVNTSVGTTNVIGTVNTSVGTTNVIGDDDAYDEALALLGDRMFDETDVDVTFRSAM